MHTFVKSKSQCCSLLSLKAWGHTIAQMDMDLSLAAASADDDRVSEVSNVSKGSWLCPPTSTSSDSLEADDMMQTNREEMRQRDQLYQSEVIARKRMYMTTMEKHQLEDLLKKKYQHGQPEIVLNLFGKPEGRAMTKQIYMEIVQTQNYSHPEAFSIILPDFTIAKSLLLSSRALQPAPPAGQECYCFPRTALLPNGCFHRKVAQGQVPLPSKKSSPWYCSVCSLCMRCNKNFGWV